MSVNMVRNSDFKEQDVKNESRFDKINSRFDEVNTKMNDQINEIRNEIKQQNFTISPVTENF